MSSLVRAAVFEYFSLNVLSCWCCVSSASRYEDYSANYLRKNLGGAHVAALSACIARNAKMGKKGRWRSKPKSRPKLLNKARKMARDYREKWYCQSESIQEKEASRCFTTRRKVLLIPHRHDTCSRAAVAVIRAKYWDDAFPTRHEGRNMLKWMSASNCHFVVLPRYPSTNLGSAHVVKLCVAAWSCYWRTSSCGIHLLACRVTGAAPV